MTEEEIVRNFKQAKNKREQIKILADLNCTSRDEKHAEERKAREKVIEQTSYMREARLRMHRSKRSN